MTHARPAPGYSLVLLLLVIVVSAGCAVPFLQTKTVGGGTFVVALDGPVLTLDPAQITELSSARVAAQIYETLVQYNSTTGAVEPLLAESWSVSDNGLVWTFVLRRGVTFHDGTPLNADAVVQNFNRWMDTANPYHRGDFDYWQILFGGFKGSGSVVRSAEQMDDLRVSVTLEQPFGPLLSALTMFPFSIVSPAALRSDADNVRRQPVGSGPFRFVQWRNETEVVLSANKSYWGGQPAIDGVRFVVMPDQTARLAALRAREVQLVEGSDAIGVEQGRKISGAKVLMRPSQTVVSLSINQKNAPFDDSRVRVALARSINRQALVTDAYAGLAQVAEQFVPPGVAGSDRGLTALTYNVQEARTLLEQSGFAGTIVTQLWYPAKPQPSLPNPRTMAESIAHDLQAIGIAVSVLPSDWPTYQRRSLDGGFPLYLQAWTGDSPDADSFLTGLFASDSVARAIGYANPALKAALSEARTVASSPQRSPLYQAAAAIVRSDMPRVPLVHPQDPVLLAGTVSGFAPSVLGVESYRSVTLAP
jgi:peptide/nickel transport system substrate-binding protein